MRDITVTTGFSIMPNYYLYLCSIYDTNHQKSSIFPNLQLSPDSLLPYSTFKDLIHKELSEFVKMTEWIDAEVLASPASYFKKFFMTNTSGDISFELTWKLFSSWWQTSSIAYEMASDELSEKIYTEIKQQDINNIDIFVDVVYRGLQDYLKPVAKGKHILIPIEDLFRGRSHQTLILISKMDWYM
ncbi:hypothetical protein [Alicyclobacillus fodiniaquatilis]|uniref:Uncharacterized protein n=1 Tax=Alicyclobacillus fodiniaquatilis TaxID=1661150 RepID=A0ABW4JGR0_9BACL